MVAIIAGSRTINNYDLVKNCISMVNTEITEVVCGMAKGVDSWGRAWAIERGIPVKEFPAEWNKFGKAAGYRRNVDMARYAKENDGCLILIWDGKSKGSGHMKNIAAEYGLKIYETIV